MESVLGQNQPKRRMPNGTYGVVGGRGLVTPSYPIKLAILRPLFAR